MEFELIKDKIRLYRAIDYYNNTYGDELSQPWPLLTYTYVFKRKTSLIYIKTLVGPVIVFTFLLSAVFFFDVRCVERLGYEITILLAMMVIEIIAADALPTCSEWLWTEIVSTVSSLFAMSCVIESSYITHLYYKQRKEDVSEYETTAMLKKNDDPIIDHLTVEDGVSSNDNSNSLISGTIEGSHLSQTIDEKDVLTESILSSMVNNAFLKKARKQIKRTSCFSRFNRFRQNSVASRYEKSFNIDAKFFDKVRKIDAISFKVFIITYPLYLIIMFASIPLWTDNYGNHPDETKDNIQILL